MWSVEHDDEVQHVVETAGEETMATDVPSSVPMTVSSTSSLKINHIASSILTIDYRACEIMRRIDMNVPPCSTIKKRMVTVTITISG